MTPIVDTDHQMPFIGPVPNLNPQALYCSWLFLRGSSSQCICLLTQSATPSRKQLIKVYTRVPILEELQIGTVGSWGAILFSIAAWSDEDYLSHFSQGGFETVSCQGRQDLAVPEKTQLVSKANYKLVQAEQMFFDVLIFVFFFYIECEASKLTVIINISTFTSKSFFVIICVIFLTPSFIKELLSAKQK